MIFTDSINKESGSFSTRIAGAIGLFLALGLLQVAPAVASYEPVGRFGEGTQLQTATGMAVNTSGAGGVPVGTIYAVSRNGGPRVIRYTASGEFREAWGWSVAREPIEDMSQEERVKQAGNTKGREEEEVANNKFQRCGPDGEVAYPLCRREESLGLSIERARSGEGVGQLFEPKGIAVDQATGNVYVYNFGRTHGTIQIFSAQGIPIGGFGEVNNTFASATENIDESPEKLHLGTGFLSDNIAVGNSGTVYVADRGSESGRVMIFKPQTPGDYEHYVYTGRAHDINGNFPGTLAVDAQGDLYSLESREFVREYSASEPNAMICQIKVPGGQVEAMTVNGESGEVFYLSAPNEKFHQLSACGPEGKFKDLSAFPLPAGRGSSGVLALDPVLSFEPSRPAGILYFTDGTHGADVFAPAAIKLPSVETESVASVGPTSAVLHAQINPRGSQVSYVFQYLTEAAYEANEANERFAGAAEAPPGGAVLGNGQATLGAATAITGLAPDTAYRYRVVATSHCNPEEEEVLCEGIGTAEAFRTFPAEAPGLVDSRAYELVSPTLKAGGEVSPLDPAYGSCFECKPGTTIAFPKVSSLDGDSVAYEGSPFSNTGSAMRENEYISKRTPSGWQTTNLSPESMESLKGDATGYKAFNAELTKGLIYQLTPSLSPEAPSEFPNLYAQDTADPGALTPLLGTEPPNRSAGRGVGHLTLRYAGASADFSQLLFEANDALTGETPFAPEAVDGGREKNNLYDSVDGAMQLVNVLPGNSATAPGATFGTGQVGFSEFNFDNVISADGSRVFWSSESGQVYVREDGEVTKEIPDHTGKFLAASADGSKVLLSDGELYDLETETLTDLSEGKGGFMGIAGQSQDLSSVYFVDTAVLGGENERKEVARPGEDNLYAHVGGTTSFIATLLAKDNELGIEVGTEVGDWHAAAASRNAEASPDGRRLAFLSRARLTGYDNTGPCIPDGSSGFPKFLSGACTEAFLYDSATGQLSCVSCNPTGVRPLGNSNLPLSLGSDFQPQTRYLLDSGRLYFDSRDSLSAFDTNEGVEDVYQYEPDGVGSCSRESGCVNLISAGSEPVDSNFLAIDATGKNVFFTSRDQLVLKDKDDLIDLYDAREGGGIASETETGRSECQGEACQVPVSPPNDPTPGSSTFEGAGNVNEEAKAKKHASKHKKKRHAKKKHSKKRAAKRNRGGAK